MMNTQEIINALTKDQIRTDYTELVVGNNVKVYQRIVEGSRTRTQMFEGTIIKVQGGGIAQTFTVRRVSYGVGVEKTWPVNSPNIERLKFQEKVKLDVQDYSIFVTELVKQQKLRKESNFLIIRKGAFGVPFLSLKINILFIVT